MLSKESLAAFGANCDEGLSRCMNNETLYFKLVQMALGDGKLAALRKALEAGNLDESFELAHALKGVHANLALTPIYQPVSTLTELLRAKQEGDYLGLYNEMKEERDRLLAM